MKNEIFFNELCLKDKTDDYSVFENLRDCYKKLKSEGFSVCRLDSDTKRTLFDYLKSISGVSQFAITNFFYSFFHAPYEKDDMSTEVEDKFLSSNLCFEDNQTVGLQWAYIYDTLAFSLLTNEKWNRDSIFVIDESERKKSISVHHAATVANMNTQKNWIDSLKQIVLQETSIPAEQKKYHVRDDHGTDVLKEFWNKLRNCEYVESCINSLPFNSFNKGLIRSIKQNGQIELVLY